MADRKEKIALFDFCDTLVSFQTANEYVRFFVKYYANLSIKLRHFIYLTLSASGLISHMEKRHPEKNIRKRILLWQLKGSTRDKMEMVAKEYYERRIKPCLISETITELLKSKKDGCKILIVSGGYDIYIKHFALEYGIEIRNIVANQLLFDKNLFIGKYDLECMGEEKVRLLNKIFEHRDDFNVVAYSDSESDLPILLWADIGIVITKSWAKKYQFKEITIAV